MEITARAFWKRGHVRLFRCGGAFLSNLRPPSDSPARKNSTLEGLDVGPAVTRFKLPMAVTLYNQSNEGETTDTDKASREFGSMLSEERDQEISTKEEEDWHGSTRKRPRENSTATSGSMFQFAKPDRKRDRSVERTRTKKPMFSSSFEAKKKKLRDDERFERFVVIMNEEFDPVTVTHLQLASEIIHSGVADEVWLMPTSDTTGEFRSFATPCRDRWLMCHLAVTSAFASDFPVKVHAHPLDYPECKTKRAILTEMNRQYTRTHFRFIAPALKIIEEELAEKEIKSKTPFSSQSSDVTTSSLAFARNDSVFGTDDVAMDADTNSNASFTNTTFVGEQNEDETKVTNDVDTPLLIVPSIDCDPSVATESPYVLRHKDCVVFDWNLDGRPAYYDLKNTSLSVREKIKMGNASMTRNASTNESSMSSRIMTGENSNGAFNADRFLSTSSMSSDERKLSERRKKRAAMRCQGTVPSTVLTYMEKYENFATFYGSC